MILEGLHVYGVLFFQIFRALQGHCLTCGICVIQVIATRP